MSTHTQKVDTLTDTIDNLLQLAETYRRFSVERDELLEMAVRLQELKRNELTTARWRGIQ